jgi:hypothetical protein
MKILDFNSADGSCFAWMAHASHGWLMLRMDGSVSLEAWRKSSIKNCTIFDGAFPMEKINDNKVGRMII